MIDLNKPDSTEKEQPSEKTEVEILKAKLKKVKRKLRSKDKYIRNLKESYSKTILAQKAEIMFDNLMLVGFAILLMFATSSIVSDHKNEKISNGNEVIQIQKDTLEKNTNTGDKVVSSNSQNLLQVAVEKSAYVTAEDVKDGIIFKALALDKSAHSSEQLAKNYNPDPISMMAGAIFNNMVKIVHEDSSVQ